VVSFNQTPGNTYSIEPYLCTCGGLGALGVIPKGPKIILGA